MNRLTRVSKLLAVAAMGGFVFAGGCLPANFWSTTWASTIVTGTVAAVQARALTALGL